MNATCICTCLFTGADEQYLLAVENCRTSVDLCPDNRRYNLFLITLQMTLLQNRKALVSDRLKSPGSGPPVEAGVELLSYLEYNELDSKYHAFPGIRLIVLPKPDNWPTRPEGGFKINTEGFD